MPALDINLINQLGRDLHNVSPGYMGEDEVCPWTLFLTMALTLLKGGYLYILRITITKSIFNNRLYGIHHYSF